MAAESNIAVSMDIKPKSGEIIEAEEKTPVKGSIPLKDARQERYCQEYLIDLVQTKAALRAKYAPISARRQASRLMTKDHIKDRIAYLQAQRTKRLEIEADSVVTELAKIGFSNIEDYLTVDDGNIYLKDFDNIERERLAAVESIKINTTTNKNETKEYTVVQFKLHNKENALEQLGKHFGIFKEDNEQRKPDVRVFTKNELIQILAEDKALDEEIAAMDINDGLAT